MTAQRIWVSIIASLFISLLFVGCLPTTSQISTTVSFSTQTPENGSVAEQTLVPTQATDAPPNTSTLEPTSVTDTPIEARPSVQLVFISNRDCASCLYGYASDIYKIDVGCLDEDEPCLGEAQLLFQWEKSIDAIDWSPDGLHLIFVSEGDIFLADGNGVNVTSLPINAGLPSYPRWSPDGTKIVFIFNAQRPGSEALDPSKIQIYDLDTQQVVDILNEVYDPTRVDWLPNGDMAYIAKASETDWTETINVVDSTGKIISQVPYDATENTHLLGFDFSPDLNQFVFVGNLLPESGPSTTDIYVTGIGDGDEISLIGSSGFNIDPVWSPQGKWIAFASNREGIFNIYLVNPNGSDIIQVTDDSLDKISPSWRLFP